MSDRLKETLDGYEDFELSFMRKYKLETYVKSTQEKLRSYIKSRSLNEQKRNALIERWEFVEIDSNTKHCPRCTSRKIQSQQVESYNSRASSIDGMAGKATYATKEVCDVCGYWISDPNDEQRGADSLWKTLFHRFWK